MDLRHRHLLGSKHHLQLRLQVKAYLPFSLVITTFDIYLQVFLQFLYIRKTLSFYWADLWKFHLRKRDKSSSKDPCFIAAKKLRNWIELHQDQYLSKCKLSNMSRQLSPFGNLSHGVFFSVDLFSRRRRPMNITGALSRNPRFHHIKTELC